MTSRQARMAAMVAANLSGSGERAAKSAHLL